jgi:hypothetical protein
MWAIAKIDLSLEPADDGSTGKYSSVISGDLKGDGPL